MNPNSEYDILAKNTIEYLCKLLENICASYDIGIVLSKDDFVDIESYVSTELSM